MSTRKTLPPVESYRDLLVWQLSTQLAVEVYRATDHFPSTQRFCLTSQMQRAAVSVASNIAEGHAQWARGSYVRHLGVARGSLKELETQLEIARQLGFLDADRHAALQQLCDRISQLLTNLRRSLIRK